MEEAPEATRDPKELPSMGQGKEDSSQMGQQALSISGGTGDVMELSALSTLRIGEGSVVGIGDRGGTEDSAGSADHDTCRTEGPCELGDTRDSGTMEQNGNGKIPNRDSGIDSPSCTVEGEVFTNEEAIDEEEQNDSVTETETEMDSEARTCVTLDNKRDSTQDEDSDMDEVSSGEQEGAELLKSEQLSKGRRVSGCISLAQ